ncbi:hypothetical protein GH714_032175 [Hevea brasiliensis]|uniref:DUF7725 domain-containing protein n=1 Tax=Hevea brasiliensis TaxID=3981 RepID=A0A6A6LDJ0_HEVBR|nr:hypothetical protein GH714_032175 [Hevea brasiliensis]
MEAATGVVAPRGASLSMSSSRKEWRVVSDHHSVRNAGDEVELERPNLGQSDERTIYEVQHGRAPADVDFCSINVDGSLDNDIMQQRIHSITRQREELQHMEIELKAQLISRSEIMEMRNRFDAQIKEHEDAAAKHKEQLLEREQAIHELERRMEEKDRELHAIKLDNEAAWAKEDLLREQNKELATFRRERDHSEAERAQHIQKIRDLQELVQDKRGRFLNCRNSLLIGSLHIWFSIKTEMERLHLHTVQQLHLELADAKERSGTYPEESRISQTSSKDISKFGQSNVNQLDVNANGATSADNGPLPNGNADNASNQAASEGAQLSTPNQLTSSQTDHNLMRSDANQGTEPDPVISSSTGEAQVLESMDRSYVVSSQPEQSLQQISSQFSDSLRLNSLDQNSEAKTNMVTVGKTSETALLDERSLLACMVRTIPAGGIIRINSTLPNRLGKMLAPLHWHDYKKKYGKLESLWLVTQNYFLLRATTFNFEKELKK